MPFRILNMRATLFASNPALNLFTLKHKGKISKAHNSMSMFQFFFLPMNFCWYERKLLWIIKPQLNNQCNFTSIIVLEFTPLFVLHSKRRHHGRERFFQLLFISYVNIRQCKECWSIHNNSHPHPNVFFFFFFFFWSTVLFLLPLKMKNERIFTPNGIFYTHTYIFLQVVLKF